VLALGPAMGRAGSRHEVGDLEGRDHSDDVVSHFASRVH
jgi:hypothetical protein